MPALIGGDNNTVPPSPDRSRVKFEKSVTPVKWLNRLSSDTVASSPPAIAATAKRSEMLSCANNTTTLASTRRKVQPPFAVSRFAGGKGFRYSAGADNFLT